MDIVWIAALAALWVLMAQWVMGLTALDRQPPSAGERP